MNVEEICSEAQTLTPNKLNELIRRLLEGLNPPSDYDVTDQEVLSRVEETRSGLVQDISHEELLSGLKHI
jgi:hypothetical protein